MTTSIMSLFDSRDGRLKRGDELLMINGKSLIGLSHSEAVDVLRSSPKLVQIVVASKVSKGQTTQNKLHKNTRVIKYWNICSRFIFTSFSHIIRVQIYPNEFFLLFFSITKL